MDCTRTSFVRKLPAWFAPSVSIVPTERPPAEWFDKPLPRYPLARARRFRLSLLVVFTSFFMETCIRFCDARQITPHPPAELMWGRPLHRSLTQSSWADSLSEEQEGAGTEDDTLLVSQPLEHHHASPPPIVPRCL